MMSPEAESLLAKNRQTPPRPTDGARSRIKERVLLRAGAAVAATAAVGTATTASAGTVTGLLAKVLATWKIGAVVIALGALGGGAALWMASNEAAPPAVVPAATSPAAPVEEEPSRAAPAIDAPVEPPAPSASVAVLPPPAEEPIAQPAARPSSRPGPKPDGLAGEVDLLRRAQSALSSGDAKTAIALCDEHAARFPNGALAAERNQLRERAKAAR